ncbi:peptidoglycan/LPS O-acetylase OafA/YrhL [Arthrobacter sp. PvP102]|uniref:acyltransferase family protein n=1 Tax=unclassified Arthrobacter TaxID=235627 RepID=UPI001B4418E9|nr:MULTISPECIES: acyltransferase [unclassified Arthrobacter]MBP1235472.1 peptidoglycan/LPS O-acetylase OafA/YrhL [Arthrobacter sp. PvP103]MBP1236431.1 peptidoglycan/LPS O-acetylase OafA/YrhL [Arthrobacter sp. PvP102]
MDALRGAAVGAVLLGHSWPGVFQGAGIVGVIVFFVLSGYLITGVLLRDIERYRKVRYGRFYAHRAFRLLPALIAFLGVYAIVELTADVLGDRSKGIIGYTLLAGFGYLKDLPLPFDVSMAIGPLWTLAVEEQFYLIWPALLVLALRRNRQGQLVGWSAAVVFSLMTASVLAMLILAPHLHSLVYALPTTWGLGLIIGSALRLYRVRMFSWFSGRRPRRLALLGAVLVLAALVFFPRANESPAFFFVGGPLAMAVAAVLVVLAASRSQVMPRWTRPLQMLGTVSYAAYLWNYVVILWLNGGSTADLPPLVAVSAILLTLLVAVISWCTVEKLGRAGRDRFDRYCAARAGAGSR